MTGVSVVVPTVGRASLLGLLAGLDRSAGLGGGLEQVLVVDDRPTKQAPLALPAAQNVDLRVLRSGGRGPARARNLGWRASSSAWVAFLDDDVEVPAEWCAGLAADLARAEGLGAGGSQGRVLVPRPAGRRSTDWERNVIGLENACWATADMAYRRPVLAAVGGFDEGFPRAYREDADLGLRVSEAGWLIVRGERAVVHPVRAAGPWVSLRAQVGNRDDARMAALHGPGWRQRSAAGSGRTGRHAALVGSAAVATAALLARRPVLAATAGTAWALGTASFAWQRIAPGPRTAREVATMVVTSVLIPPLAVFHRLAGAVEVRLAPPAVQAVLFDRDGTLIDDVPYNGDPDLVRPVRGAREAVARLRARGLKVAVVSNQSGVARGLLDREQVERVNRRVDELVGPMDSWHCCLHGPEDQCPCRKPQPGLIHQAATSLGVRPEHCVVIGDIGADVEAAAAAGARAILVPTAATRPGEVDRAPEVAPDLTSAVERVLEGGRG